MSTLRGVGQKCTHLQKALHAPSWRYRSQACISERLYVAEHGGCKELALHLCTCAPPARLQTSSLSPLCSKPHGRALRFGDEKIQHTHCVLPTSSQVLRPHARKVSSIRTFHSPAVCPELNVDSNLCVAWYSSVTRFDF